MAILSDKWIRAQAAENGMIEPFVEAQRRDNCISYGLSSFGYDARVAPEFKIFTNVNSSVVDPKPIAASSRPTVLRWRGRSNISASPKMCW